MTEATPDEHFGLKLGAAVVVAAVVRLAYVLTDTRHFIGGDGFEYHYEALRFADGHPYTSVYNGLATANHPPGWVTVLGVVSWLGARGLRAHQLVGVVIGCGIVVLAGLIGRRYFSARVGVVAALLAALYPGFWVVEGNILSEPLGLLILGVLMLLLADLRDRPTIRRSVAIGVICGLLALVRSEQLALVAIVVAPILLCARALSPRRRAALLVAAVFACGLVLSPWTIYNSTRFKDPVLLSTNDGNLFLIGNCPPLTYRGPLLGYYATACTRRVVLAHPGLDESQRDGAFRRAGFHNIADNLGRLPVAVPARLGRMLAVFRPSQTVALVAAWMTTGHRPIWAWVVSFWLLVPLAIAGALRGRRDGTFLLPLLGPVLIACVVVAVSFGDPRYHTPADLGIIVLAAAGADHLIARRGRAPSAAGTESTGATSPPVPDLLQEA